MAIPEIRKFMLIGFPDGWMRQSCKSMDNDRYKAEVDIGQLGGLVVDETQGWRQSITHVVQYAGKYCDKDPHYIECAISAGRHALRWDYIQKSVENRRWLPERDYVLSAAVHERVRARRNDGDIKGLLFWDVKMALVLPDWSPEQKQRLVEVINAGDGKVSRRWNTFQDFIDHPPGVRELSHVVTMGWPSVIYSDECETVREQLDS